MVRVHHGSFNEINNLRAVSNDRSTCLPSRRGTIGACRYPLGCVRRFQLRARCRFSIVPMPLTPHRPQRADFREHSANCLDMLMMKIKSDCRMLTVELLRTVTELFADGGVIQRNPSSIGGVWAIRSHSTTHLWGAASVDLHQR
jgi:hypothetical protein